MGLDFPIDELRPQMCAIPKKTNGSKNQSLKRVQENTHTHRQGPNLALRRNSPVPKQQDENEEDGNEMDDRIPTYHICCCGHSVQGEEI
jgi:hypothetical protein